MTLSAASPKCDLEQSSTQAASWGVKHPRVNDGDAVPWGLSRNELTNVTGRRKTRGHAFPITDMWERTPRLGAKTVGSGPSTASLALKEVLGSEEPTSHRTSHSREDTRNFRLYDFKLLESQTAF